MKEKIVKLLSILNIEKAERLSIMYLLLQAFFTGMFNGALYIIAHSFFMKSKYFSHLPEALIMAGVVSLFLVVLFHILASFVKFKTAKIIYSVFLALGVFFLLLSQYFFDFPRYPFYMFVAVFPLQIISLQMFNSTLDQYFKGPQSVRFFGILNNSVEFGLVVVGFLVSLYASIGFNTKYLYIFCIVAYLGALINEFLFARHQEGADESQRTFDVVGVLSNRFMRPLLLFLLFSSVIGFMIHYGFLVISVSNFQSPIGLLKFFGVFMGTMYLFMYMAKRFLFGRLLNNLGMPYSMVLSPIITGIFILFAALIGWRLGFENAFSGYTFFFMFFAAAKYIESLFKYAVESPSSNIILSTIKNIDLKSMKELMQGPVFAISLLITGLIMYLKVSIFAFNVQGLSLIIAGLSVIWFIISVRLIQRYRRNLKMRFAELNQEPNVPNHLSLPKKNDTLIFKYFDENNDEKSLYILKLINSLSPLEYTKYLINYLNQHRKSELIKYVLIEIGKYNIFQAMPLLNELKVNIETNLKPQVENVIKELEYDPEKQYSYEDMIEKVFSTDVKAKKDILRQLVEKSDSEIDKVLPLLLKDIEPEIVTLAMIQAKNLRVESCLANIAEYLFHDYYYALAYDVLIVYGEMAVQSIQEIYYSDYIDQKSRKRIIRLLGDICSKNAITSLLDNLDENDLVIKNEVILSLRKQQYKAVGDEANLVMRHIVRAVENCVRNLAIHWSIRGVENNELIINALNKEVTQNYLQIFGLLSLLYENKKLNYIYDLVLHGNSEILSFAIEMFDFILNEDLKNIIFPLFDDTVFNDKMKQLQYYFPVELSDGQKSLRKIINRENNLISPWTKSVALFYYLSHQDIMEEDDLVSCMFHPVKILRETAAYVLNETNNERFKNVLMRLPDEMKSELSLTMEYVKLNSGHLIINRIFYLKSYRAYFNELTDDTLVRFVSSFEPLYLDSSEVYTFADDEDLPLLWVFEGAIKATTNTGGTYDLSEGEIYEIGGVANMQGLIGKETSILYVLKRNVLNELLSEDKKLLEVFLKFANDAKVFKEEFYTGNYNKVLA